MELLLRCLVACYMVHTLEAFVHPLNGGQHRRQLTFHSNSLASVHCADAKAVRSRLLTQLWAAAADDDEDDDDEDDEDESDEPLGNGVDSVSWLPSVIGGKGISVSGTRMVRFVILLFTYRGRN